MAKRNTALLTALLVFSAPAALNAQVQPNGADIEILEGDLPNEALDDVPPPVEGLDGGAAFRPDRSFIDPRSADGPRNIPVPSPTPARSQASQERDDEGWSDRDTASRDDRESRDRSGWRLSGISGGGYRVVTPWIDGYGREWQVSARPRLRTLTSERSFTYASPDTATLGPVHVATSGLPGGPFGASAGGPEFIDVEKARLDRRRHGPDGLQITSRGGPKIIHIARWSDEVRQARSIRHRTETD